MGREVVRSEGLGQPNIKSATVLMDGQEVRVPTLDGKVYREGVAAQLGKRFVCAQAIETTTTREVTDPKTNKTSTVTTKTTSYVDGSVKDTDGKSIYLGCGTEILCVKPSVEKSVPSCCDIPMSLRQPQVLPSAD